MFRTTLAAAALSAMAALGPVTADAGGSVSLSITANGGRNAQTLQTGLMIYNLIQNNQNAANVRQNGAGNSAALRQSGGGHQGTIHQDGSNHSASLTQRGRNHSYGIFQFGRGTSGQATQAGRGQSGVLFQYGW